MFGSGIFALLFAVGVATWVFTKVNRRSGTSNNRPAIIVAAMVGIFAFIVFFTVFKLFLHE
jgi:hypothetical protein